MSRACLLWVSWESASCSQAERSVFCPAVLFNIVPQLFDIVAACIFISAALEPWIAVIVFITLGSYIPVTVFLTEWRVKHRRCARSTRHPVTHGPLAHGRLHSLCARYIASAARGGPPAQCALPPMPQRLPLRGRLRWQSSLASFTTSSSARLPAVLELRHCTAGAGIGHTECMRMPRGDEFSLWHEHKLAWHATLAQPPCPPHKQPSCPAACLRLSQEMMRSHGARERAAN